MPSMDKPIGFDERMAANSLSQGDVDWLSSQGFGLSTTHKNDWMKYPIYGGMAAIGIGTAGALAGGGAAATGTASTTAGASTGGAASLTGGAAGSLGGAANVAGQSTSLFSKLGGVQGIGSMIGLGMQLRSSAQQDTLRKQQLGVINDLLKPGGMYDVMERQYNDYAGIRRDVAGQQYETGIYGLGVETNRDMRELRTNAEAMLGKSGFDMSGALNRSLGLGMQEQSTNYKLGAANLGSQYGERLVDIEENLQSQLNAIENLKTNLRIQGAGLSNTGFGTGFGSPGKIGKTFMER